MTVPPEKLAMAREARLGLVAEREQRFLGAEATTGLRQRHDLVRRHRVGAGLARIAPEGAVAAVVAAQRRKRHEDLGGERDRAAPAAIAQLAGAGEEIRKPCRGRVDERARVLVRDHQRRRAAFFLEDGFAPPRFDAALAPPAARESFGRTSCAKRSMFARTA